MCAGKNRLANLRHMLQDAAGDGHRRRHQLGAGFHRPDALDDQTGQISQLLAALHQNLSRHFIALLGAAHHKRR